MSNNAFQFKQFNINQEFCAMKVGTDGVLLGAWAPLAEACHILDIGTGTGLISLMAAQRNPSAHIDAIEIDEACATQAAQNFEESPWNNRIALHHCDVQSYDSGQQKYDFIVTNPPYFEASLKPQDQARSAARHTDSLPVPALIECADRLLSEDGQLAIICPTTLFESLLQSAAMHRLHCAVKCEVKTLSHKPIKRLMLLFSRHIPDYVFRKEELCIYSAPGIYSDEYKQLTDAFYISLK